jgi:GTPase
MKEHKAGFVNIIGKPNVGKSTLMNAFLGEKLAITTPKAQTTRHRILGILNTDDYQIVFSDTPGIIKPAYKLQQAMMKAVESVFEDADIMLWVLEAGENQPDEELLMRLKSMGCKTIIVLNKSDLVTPEELALKETAWQQLFPESTVIAVSALLNANITKLKDIIVGMLPNSPPYYDKEEISDRNTRFFVAEIIREKILLLFRKEIPYSVEVIVEDFKEKPTENITHIAATVFVARDSQKAILLGHQGKAIKKLGTLARKDIEAFVNQRVYLDLSIKVSKDWRNEDNMLKRFGYEF